MDDSDDMIKALDDSSNFELPNLSLESYQESMQDITNLEKNLLLQMGINMTKQQ